MEKVYATETAKNHEPEGVEDKQLNRGTREIRGQERPNECISLLLSASSRVKKTPRIAAFGPSRDKKMRLLQSVFHQIPRNPMMAWN
jgi:hypothetical protein